MSLFAPYEPTRPDGPRIEAGAVRAACPSDVPRIAAISIARDGGDPEDVVRRVGFEVGRLSEDPPWAVFVAEVEGGVVAYGRVRFLEPEDEAAPSGWYLTGVVVDPGFRRRGIASALTRARIDWVRARADTLYYFVSRKNRPSIELHASFGFTLVGPVAHARSNLTRDAGRLYRLDLQEDTGA